jgi:hypothetical protein
VNLTDTRQRIAATLTAAIDGVTVHPHQPTSVRVLDGWCVLRSITPSTFQTCTATFDVLIVVGTDEQAAADFLDRASVDLIDATGQHLGAPVTLTPQSLTLGSTEMFCAALSLLIEVD